MEQHSPLLECRDLHLLLASYRTLLLRPGGVRKRRPLTQCVKGSSRGETKSSEVEIDSSRYNRMRVPKKTAADITCQRSIHHSRLCVSWGDRIYSTQVLCIHTVVSYVPPFKKADPRFSEQREPQNYFSEVWRGVWSVSL